MNSITNSLKGTHPVTPVITELNIRINGTTPTLVTVPVDAYTYISRVIPIMRFLTNTVDWAKFGNDTALATGIQMKYNGTDLGHSIKANYDLFDNGYDITIVSDDKNPKSNIISARWSFDKWTPYGLAMWHSQTFGFLVSNDILAATSILDLHMHVQGWKVNP